MCKKKKKSDDDAESFLLHGQVYFITLLNSFRGQLYQCVFFVHPLLVIFSTFLQNSTVSFKKLSLHQMFSSLYTGWLLISSRGWFLAVIYMTTVVMRKFECSSTRGFCIVSIPSNQTSATASWTTFKSLMVNLSTGDYRLSVTNVSTPETWKTSDRALSFYRWIFLFLFTNPCNQSLSI